ncbi:TetR/AcrR family transcriptional regulator [Caballeronia ptereochthonis]|uniref:TetR family regulatory protein n=1 Tax=Caballeronia ptereochthonis TaxID=1777144 RepID=A0A158AJY7_9BURK|nr:TetR/AcrR family transcriptional regulator [Caballeronia ptereochthonis]SAK58080.1 TetR family regulatory protein [Caballeronia ptereochthonis]
MKQERLTRAQRKKQTRERLLDAAERMFVRKGFAATSVDDISDEAGYTRGAFYFNFDSKAEVLIELLQREGERTYSAIQAILKEGATPVEMKQRATAYFIDSLGHDSFSLWAEGSLLASRDAAYRDSINVLRRQRLAATDDCIRSIWVTDQARLSHGRAEALALGMSSICDGIRLFKLGNGKITSDEKLHTVAVELISWLIELSPSDTAPRLTD